MIGILVALLMAMICILVHSEAVALVQNIGDRLSGARMSLLVTWGGLLSAHVVEVWLYAIAYWVCAAAGVGSLIGVNSAVDYGYFSAVVYTTLGFGDIVPDEGLQLLAGSEALVGLCLIAWSATATYGHHTSRRVEEQERHELGVV